MKWPTYERGKLYRVTWYQWDLALYTTHGVLGPEYQGTARRELVRYTKPKEVTLMYLGHMDDPPNGHSGFYHVIIEGRAGVIDARAALEPLTEKNFNP